MPAEPNVAAAAPDPTSPVSSRYTPDGTDSLAGLLERLRREPALRQWVLAAPTGALATLGVALDDAEIVELLEQIEALDERPLPVTAADVMTPQPITVLPTATVHEAAEILFEHRISGLPVVDADGNLVGVLSEYDLIARAGNTVGEIMSGNVVSVPDTATVEAVRAVFVSRMLKRVPVVNREGKLVGLISRADLVRELAYRWACESCGYVVRSRHAPERCSHCGSSAGFQPAPPAPAVVACPTCGRPLEGDKH